MIYLLALLFNVSFLASCATYSNGRGNKGLPPGQAKKIHGTKSAKPFAPGQRKKNNKKRKHKNNRHDSRVILNYYVPIWKY